jgi:arylsulfatase A-like enzyme
MNKLRHDLSTSGWSMFDCRKWLDRFNDNWKDSPFLSFKYWNLLPDVYRDFIGEMDWLLHEALPEEKFKATDTISISDWSEHGWHQDYCYLRVLFAPRGEGTVVARSFDNNLITPYGYGLIFSGIYRKWKTQIPATWHTSPHNEWCRRLFVLTFGA